MSGHSKWANIKHRKGKQDAIRGRMFTRIAKEIAISAREGGGSPDMNPRLRLAIQNGKAVNMPNDNISRAIKKGTGELDGVSYEEITYEGYAPFGVAVVLETVTDNRNRTVADVRSSMSKYGGNMGESNSVLWNFERKGVIVIENGKNSEEDLFNHVLEAEADDLEFDDESSRIICSMESFANANRYFDENKFVVKESKLEYIPKQTVSIKTVEEAKKVLRFIDYFEDHDDVQNIFYNFEIDDSIADQLD